MQRQSEQPPTDEAGNHLYSLRPALTKHNKLYLFTYLLDSLCKTANKLWILLQVQSQWRQPKWTILGGGWAEESGDGAPLSERYSGYGPGTFFEILHENLYILVLLASLV